MAQFYEISDDLSDPQKEFFGRLNHILQVLDASTQDYSNHYQEAVTDVVYGVGKNTFEMISEYATSSKSAKVPFYSYKRDPLRSVAFTNDNYESPYLKYTKLPFAIRDLRQTEPRGTPSRTDAMDFIQESAKMLGGLRKRDFMQSKLSGIIHKTLVKGAIWTTSQIITSTGSAADGLTEFASGDRFVEQLARQHDYSSPIITVHFPQPAEMMMAGIEGATWHLANLKNLSGETRDQITNDLSVMKALTKMITKPQEEIHETELANVLKLQGEKARVRARGIPEKWQQRQATRERPEQEQPVPYELGEGQREAQRLRKDATGKNWTSIRDAQGAQRIRGMDSLWDEFSPVVEKLNRKLPHHAALGDALLHDGIIRQAVFTATPSAESIDAKEMKRILGNGAAEHEQLRQAIRETLAIANAPEASGSDRKLQDIILSSPTIAVVAQGDPDALKTLRKLSNVIFSTDDRNESAQAYAARTRQAIAEREGLRRAAWKSLGVDIPEPAAAIPVAANTEPEAPAAVQPEPPPFIITAPRVKPVIPIVAAPVILQAPESALPRPAEPVRQPAPVSAPSAPPKSPAGIFTVPAALDAQKKQMITDADQFMMESFYEGYNQFTCAFAFGNRNCLRLQFCNDEGDVRTKDLNLPSHDLQNNVLLKIAVQSHVLGQGDIAPIRHRGRKGEVSILREDFVQFHAGDEQTSYEIKSTNGLLSLEITSWDRREGEKMTLGIQLGLADTPGNQEEAVRREKIVRDYLHAAFLSESKITKREVLDHLRAQVHGKWQGIEEQMQLEGYHEATDFPFPPEASGQKTMLSPVSIKLQPGGVNPSYILDFTLRVYPEGASDKKGFSIKHRAMNLHTTDEGLALARANKAIVQLQEMFMAAARQPGASWALEPDGQEGMRLSRAAELPAGRIGWNDLHEKYLNAMTHYEDDLKAQLKAPPVTGDDGITHFTVEVVRGNNRHALEEPYNLRAAQLSASDTSQEAFRVSEMRTENPVQLAVDCMVPAAVGPERIAKFVDKVNSDFMGVVGEHYTNVAFDESGEIIGKSKHFYQYNFKTAQSFFNESVQANLPMLGEDAIVAPSWHGDEVLTAARVASAAPSASASRWA